MNKPIHVFGCSLAACAELSGTGLTAVAEEDVQYMWPNVLANKLDTQCYNWSRAGATNRDIAMCAIQAMSEHDGTFIVAWTWPERTNYWKPQLDDLDFNNYIVTLAMISPEFKKLSKKDHPIKSHPELIDHWKMFAGEREWIFNTLANFQLVEMTARALGKQCVHILVGANFHYLNSDNFIHEQTVPHRYHNAEETDKLGSYLMPMPTIEQHAMYKVWCDSTVLFREQGLWEHMHTKWEDDNTLDTKLSGTHWSKEGCADIAEMIYNELN